jgi:multiple sugar transport system permease protein
MTTFTTDAPPRPATATPPPKPRRSNLARRRARTAYLFLAPCLLFFVLLFFYPLGVELVTSLHTGPRADEFTGVGNYLQAFEDPQARNAFFVTLKYAAGVVVVSVLIGLGLATILNQKLRGRAIFRGILLIPYLTSIAIVGLLWRNILDPQVGILNRVLGALGLPQQTWLNTHPLETIILVTTWQEVGYVTVLFLAGMQGIPSTYYEAARIDGASPLQTFRHVTLPLLVPTTLFVSVISVIGALQQFALPYIITGGGPGNATDLYVHHGYLVAFSFRDIGYASALSYLFLIVILALTVLQLRLGKRDSHA